MIKVVFVAKIIDPIPITGQSHDIYLRSEDKLNRLPAKVVTQIASQEAGSGP